MKLAHHHCWFVGLFFHFGYGNQTIFLMITFADALLIKPPPPTAQNLNTFRKDLPDQGMLFVMGDFAPHLTQGSLSV